MLHLRFLGFVLRSAALGLVFCAFAAQAQACKEAFGTDKTYSHLFDSATGKLVDGAWVRKAESDTVVVFVHGIFSNNRDAWLAETAPCAYWPRLVSTDPSFAKAGIFVASYYAPPESGPFTIRDGATQLYTVLASAWGESFAPLQYPKILFVTHSLGGIVTRQMVEQQWPSFQNHDMVGLALMASPARGSGWAARANFIARKWGNQLLQELSPDSPVLKQTHESFRQLMHRVRSLSRPQLVGMEQFENHFLVCSWLPRCLLPDLEIRPLVSPEDAGEYFVDPPAVIGGTDHSTIVKPESLNNQSHLRLQLFYNRHFAGDVVPAPSGPAGASVTLKGSRPVYGWTTVSRSTLDLVANPHECHAGVPGGCRARLKEEGRSAGPPAVGERRWVPVTSSDKKVALLGDVADYQFGAEPGKPEIWAKSILDGSKSVVRYSKEYVLEEFALTGKQPFSATTPLCATPWCTVQVNVPADVDLQQMVEQTSLGTVTTAWDNKAATVGRAVRYAGLDPGGTIVRIQLAPWYMRPGAAQPGRTGR